VPDDVVEALMRLRGRMDGFGDTIKWFEEVGSTNDVALQLAAHGFAEGTLVGADMQTAGRGRQGRHWVSPPGAGLYVSIILRPPAGVAPLLTMAAGVAAADGIREATGLIVSLKWPNDVYVGSRKLAGILAEGGTSGSALDFVVLGTGINLMPAAYPPDVASRATSLEFELARPVDRGLVLATCLAGLAHRYRQLMTGKREPVLSAWRVYGAHTLGRAVECTVGSRTISGVAEDINDRGELLVRTGDQIVPVTSGEVRWQ
jgi:BirA family transcriptional regulator, biotin operon repressor / biotin---[acetyl-CoA-carboxylase] ligase